MNRIWLKISAVFTFLFFMLPGSVLAAGAGGAGNIVIVADTRRFGPVLSWWTDMYNDSHLYFALVTIIIIPVIGVIMGVIADLVMARIGIDLKSRDLAEH